MTIHWQAMRRWAFNILTGLSLVLCLATVVLWARSYDRQGWVKRTHRGSIRCYVLTLANFPGRLCAEIAWQAADAPPRRGAGWAMPPLAAAPRWQTWASDAPRGPRAYDATLPHRPDLYQFAGIAWYSDHSYASSWNLLVPHRYVALLFAVLPLCRAWARGRRWHCNRRRRRLHLCLSCGYDLRAHSPGQLCPECGSAIAADPLRKHIA